MTYYWYHGVSVDYTDPHDSLDAMLAEWMTVPGRHDDLIYDPEGEGRLLVPEMLLGGSA